MFLLIVCIPSIHNGIAHVKTVCFTKRVLAKGTWKCSSCNTVSLRVQYQYESGVCITKTRYCVPSDSCVNVHYTQQQSTAWNDRMPEVMCIWTGFEQSRLLHFTCHTFRLFIHICWSLYKSFLYSLYFDKTFLAMFWAFTLQKMHVVCNCEIFCIFVPVFFLNFGFSTSCLCCHEVLCDQLYL